MQFNSLKNLPWGASRRSSSRLGRWIEVVLMFALALQIARLFWVLLSPPGAFGDWRPFEPAVPGPQARAALFAAFDPFFRDGPVAGGADVQQVTALPLRLYGIRVNEGSGLGSAIIADQSGKQSSFAVGDEIAPGVILKGVSYDHVTLARNGTTETLFIDQSDSAPAAAPASTSASGSAPIMPARPSFGRGNPAPIGGDAQSSQALQDGIGFAPRTENGAITGVTVSPQGAGDAFSRAGLRPGDVVAQVNGTPIRSAQDIASLRNALQPGARLTLMVERGAATVPIAITIPDNK